MEKGNELLSHGTIKIKDSLKIIAFIRYPGEMNATSKMSTKRNVERFDNFGFRIVSDCNLRMEGYFTLDYMLNIH